MKGKEKGRKGRSQEGRNKGTNEQKKEGRKRRREGREKKVFSKPQIKVPSSKLQVFQRW